MNLLLTGGLGHIGTYFLSRVHEIKTVKKIYIIDKIEERIVRLVNLKLKKKVTFINLDLSKNKIKKNILKKIDCVMHLSSITNAEASVGNEKEIFKNNLGCFKNVLDFCKKKNISFIHFSSTSVYGSQDLHVDENCKELLPQSPYANIKIIEEKMLRKTPKKFKFVTLRLGTIVGPSSGMRFHTAVNKFCLQTYLNKPLTVWKTAFKQYRPYLSISDSFKAFKFILENQIFDRDIYNILSKNLTVEDIVKIINKFKKTKINFVGSKIMNQLSYKVRKTKIENQGLKINSNLKDEIKKTLKILDKKILL